MKKQSIKGTNQMNTSTNATDLTNLTDEEIELRLELLRRSRLTGVQKPAVVAQQDKVKEKEQPATDWGKVLHTCPQCGRHGPVDSMFGTRTVRGKVLKQSWCADCRAGTNYHAAPRKNNRKVQ